MANGFQELSQGLQTVSQTMTGLVSSQDGQAGKLSQLIQALGKLLHSNVTAEIWRQQAEQRLSHIEDWIDKQDDEAS